jgi:tetratricopeptide (TPR) repeat protein
VQRGAGEELFVLEPDEGEDEIRYYPDASDFVAAIAGRPRDLEKELGPPLLLEITNADVREAKYPVLVGHYAGDPIVSAESALDGALDGILSRDLRLERYPGSPNTVRIYDGSDSIPGVIVVGLGQVGQLRRLTLEGSLRSALIEYAIQNLPAEAESAAELSVSSLLIGTFGGTQVSVEESVAALVEAALATNLRLEELGLTSRVRIRRVEIVELYRNIATEAAHAALRVEQRYDGRVTAAPVLRTRKTARRSRPFSPYGSGWSGRIRIKAVESKLEYEVTTDLARTEPHSRPVQWSLVDGLLESAMSRDPEAPATLFQYLLPYEFVDRATRMPDVVLELDSEVAHIPWEILSPAPEESQSSRPLGVRVGMLRLLLTEERRQNPRRSKGRRALVIGEPAGVEPPLPGASEEALEVSRLLSRRNLEVSTLVGDDPDAIIRALYRHEYQIVHIAAHGEFHEDGTRSGVLLSRGRYLTSAEFENLRAVPSIVFLNCCHLGKMGNSAGVEPTHLRHPGRLAASLAKHLIRMGVGVVVAAGWAVGDAEARAFADRLYSELLDGNTLMEAVRVARERTYTLGGSEDLTWGAYQVYGDPGYVLHWAERRGSGYQPRDRLFVSSHELHEHILDFSARGRGAEGLERDRLKEELERLERKIPDQWIDSGQIVSATAKAYAELGFYEKAIESYQKALSCSDVPVEVIEQLANVEGRAAEKTFLADRKQANQWFDDSIKRLSDLCEIRESSERRALIGATLKRRAKVTPTRTVRDRKARERYIRAARKEYAKACKLEPPNLYYPLSQKVALELSLDPEEVKDEDLNRIVVSARECDDEWTKAAIAEVGLLRFLASGEGSPTETAKAYLDALGAGAGASRRERDSIIGQIDTLVELILDNQVKARAQSVQKAVRDMLGDTS